MFAITFIISTSYRRKEPSGFLQGRARIPEGCSLAAPPNSSYPGASQPLTNQMLLSEPQGAGCVLCALQNQKRPGQIKAKSKKSWANRSPGGPLAERGTGCSNLNPERERGRGQGRGASPFPPGRGLRLRPAALPIHPQSRSQTEPKVPRARSLAHVSPWGERQLPHLPVSHVLGGLGLVASSLWTSVFLKRGLNSISPRSLQVPPRTLPAVTCFSQI